MESARARRSILQASSGGSKGSSVYEKAYEVPGVVEVVKQRVRRPLRGPIIHGASGETFEVSEKIISAGILLFILILGILSRVL